MGVDGPRRRAQGLGRGLTNPFRTETVEIRSTRGAREVLARIDERAERVDYPWSWYRGRGVVRRGQGDERQLAVRHSFRDDSRPVAFVRVWPDGTGSRVGATICPSSSGLLAIAIGPILLLVLVMNAPFRLWPLFVLVFAAAVVSSAARSDTQRRSLRALLEEAAAP